MSANKHTPRPWRVELQDVRGFSHVFIIGAGAQMVRTMHNTDAELEANARLIAAAPELLEALEIFAELVPCEHSSEHSGCLCPGCKARSAIAKVKGE